MMPIGGPNVLAANRRGVLAAMLGAAGAIALLGACEGAPRDRTSDGDPAELNALLDALLEEMLRSSPELATSLGLDVGPRAALKFRLDDRSGAGVAERADLLADQLKRLEAVDKGALLAFDAVNLEAVRADLAARVFMARAFPYDALGLGRPYVVSHLTGAYGSIPDFLDAKHTAVTPDDADAYIARVRQFAVEIGHETDRAKNDAELGVLPPSFVIERALQQITALYEADPSASLLASALARKANEAGLAQDYSSQTTGIVRDEVYPALQAQATALASLPPVASDEAGVWRLPDGAAYYEAALKQSTTADHGPEELHKMGLEQTAHLGGVLDDLLAGQGLTEGGRAERMIALLTDPRYVYTNDEAGRAQLIADITAKLDALAIKLPEYFHALPKTKLEIRRAPPFLEAGAPFAYYQDPSIDGKRPGAFYVNLRDTRETPSWILTTTAFHEGVPGHHFQQAVLQEGPPIPDIRKVLWSSGYSEGWALYAEQMADELGMYDADPVGRIGYVWSALLRAARLAVDTGIHHKRWTRNEAINWMIVNGGFPPPLATGEVERYCVWPGQACSYMVGKMAWLELRDRARSALGPSYDIRDFHAAALKIGSVPLTLLEDVVGTYIEAAQGFRPRFSRG